MQLSNTAITKEVREISTKDLRRKQALMQSESELDKDKTKALEFLNLKDAEEKDLVAHKELLVRQKAEKEEKIRSLDTELLQMQSLISKD